MGNTQLPLHQRLSFIDPPEQHVAEVEGPDAVVDFFEADAVLPEGRREVEQPRLEPDGPLKRTVIQRSRSTCRPR